MMFITLQTTSDLDDLGTKDTKGKKMCAVVVCGAYAARVPHTPTLQNGNGNVAWLLKVV